MDIPFQRKGGGSNSKVGEEFERLTLSYFLKNGISLEPSFLLPIGITEKKLHKFDFGNSEKKIIIECKSHCWTESDNIPSAKITTWDQAMFYFYVAPDDYKKILFVLRDCSNKRGESLAEYYIRLRKHLIPLGVVIIEFDIERMHANKIFPKNETSI
jgi:hypothetical protein